MEWSPLLGYAIVLFVAAHQLVGFALNHDVGSFLLVVRGLQEGRPYSDMNMPSNLWLPYVSVFISERLPFRLADIHQFVLFVFSFLCSALFVLVILQQKTQNIIRFAAILGTTSILLVLPGYQFGQREHLFALSCAPLLATLYSRRSDIFVPVTISILVAVVAAFGASQKPFFILFMVGLGGIDFALRRFRGLARELVLIYILIAVYLVWITWAYPAYFSEMLPGAVAVYGSMRLPLSLALIMAFMTPLAAIKLFFLNTAMFGFGSHFSVQRHPVSVETFVCFVLIAIAAWASGFIQRFGFAYHFLPFTLFVAGASVIIFAWLIGEFKVFLGGRGFRLDQKSAESGGYVSVLLFIYFLLNSLSAIDPLQLSRQAVLNDSFTKALQQLPPRTPILMLSTRVTPITPIHAYADIRWTGRFPNLLSVLAVVDAWEHSPEAKNPLLDEKKFCRHCVNESFMNPAPQIVFVDVSKVMGFFLTFRHPDIVAFLSEGPEFQKIWSGYEKVSHITTVYGQELDVYEKK